MRIAHARGGVELPTVPVAGDLRGGSCVKRAAIPNLPARLRLADG